MQTLVPLSGLVAMKRCLLKRVHTADKPRPAPLSRTNRETTIVANIKMASTNSKTICSNLLVSRCFFSGAVRQSPFMCRSVFPSPLGAVLYVQLEQKEIALSG